MPLHEIPPSETTPSEPSGARRPAHRPTGSDQIRAAVVRAAARRFAAEGLGVSLRAIAADAGVNVGLIHRHIGNKDDLVREVLAAQARAGADAVARAADKSEAFDWIFRQLASGGDYVRIVAWLLLGQRGHSSFQQEYPTIRALREKVAAGGDELPLMAAMALVYGWALFGDQLLDAFGMDTAEHADINVRLGALTARLVESA